MTTSPTKRSVGRPRKNAKKQENPDCEVATKGFVKRVARKLDTMHNMNHNHLPSCLCWLALGMLYAIVAFLIALPIHEIAIISLIPLSISLHDFMMHAAVKNDQRKDCSFMQKHEDPPCEPKRGCEE